MIKRSNLLDIRVSKCILKYFETDVLGRGYYVPKRICLSKQNAIFWNWFLQDKLANAQA